MEVSAAVSLAETGCEEAVDIGGRDDCGSHTHTIVVAGCEVTRKPGGGVDVCAVRAGEAGSSVNDVVCSNDDSPALVGSGNEEVSSGVEAPGVVASGAEGVVISSSKYEVEM